MLKYSVLLLMVVAQIVMADEQVSYLDKATKVGENVWIGAQPSEQDFNEFAAEEVGAVINTRTMAEMKQLVLPEEMGEKFKVMVASKNTDTPVSGLLHNRWQDL